MSATLLSLLVWLPFLILAVTFGIIFAFLGYQRGSAKAGISLAVTLISSLLSVLLAKLVAGSFAASLAPTVRNLLGKYADMMSGEHFSALVTGCASALVSLILFVPCFMLVLILFKNLTSCVFTKKMPAPKKTANKVGGLAIGIADALLLSFLLLLPLYGTLNLGGEVFSVVAALDTADNGEESIEIPLMSVSTNGSVRPVSTGGQGSGGAESGYADLLNAILYTPLSDIAGLPLFNDIYNDMASFTSPDGETVSVTETASTVTKVASAVISFKNGEEGAKEAMLSAMDHLEKVMTENSFFAGLACDVASVAVDAEKDLPIQYAGLTDKTVLQQDMKAIFTVARAAVESDLVSELMNDKPDFTQVDIKTFASGVSEALNSTESVAQLKADLLNTVIDVALERIAGDDEAKLTTLRESVGTVDATPLTGDALAAEGDSLYLIMNAALTISSNTEDAKLSDTSKAAGDLIEGLARHPSFGVDKVVDVAGELLDMTGSGSTASGSGMDETTKESIKETLKDALNNSVSKPVGEATFGEFVGTTASAAEILTQVQSGKVDLATMESILNAKPDVLQQLEDTLTGELLTSLGLDGESADIMFSLAHALFGALRENDMTADEKKAEAVVLSDALALIFNMGNIQEGEVEATARALVNSYLDSRILCATAKALGEKGANPFGIEVSDADKAEIRPVFLQAIEEFSVEDPEADEKIGYLATLIGVELN